MIGKEESFFLARTVEYATLSQGTLERRGAAFFNAYYKSQLHIRSVSEIAMHGQ